MASEDISVRRSIIDACKSMTRQGINQGTAGNMSVRWKTGLLITPSGLPYDEMTVDDIVFMNLDGSYQHKLAVSSECRFPRDILQNRLDANAVVHAHPIHATAFAICGMEIPAVHYMIAAAGNPTIRCARCATYGTVELSDAVLEALTDRNCTLLGNHGMIATGPDLRESLQTSRDPNDGGDHGCEGNYRKEICCAVELNIVDRASDSTIGRTLKKTFSSRI